MTWCSFSHLFLISLIVSLSSPTYAEEGLAKSLGDTINRLNDTLRHKWNETLCQCEIPSPEEKKLTEKWQKAGFKNPETETIRLAQPLLIDGVAYTHELEISLVMFRQTGWSTLLVRNSMREMALILNQCQIKLAPAKLVVVDAPEKWWDVSQLETREISRQIPPLKKPTFYFVRSAEGGQTAFAWPQFTCRQGPHCDTAWMTNEINTQPYKERRSPVYSPSAHELGHILGNTNHYEGDEPNLLKAFASQVNATITKEQCDTFRKHPAVKKL